MIEHSAASARAASRTQASLRWLSLGDRAVLALVIVALLVVTSLPYLYGYAASPADQRFTGIMLNVPDNVQYLSWLRDHRTDLLISNRLTPEANEPALFNLLWLVVARVAVATGWSVPLLFHGLRAVAGTVALLTLYALCRYFTSTRAERWCAILLVACGAGLGWVWVVDKYLNGLPDVRFPFDLYVAEPNIVLSLLAFPHFLIAAALIMGVFLLFLRALRLHSWASAALAALLGLTLTLQHAYDLLIITLVPAGALVLIALRDRSIPWFGGLALLLIGAVATPPALYFTILTSRDPLWREVLAQFANAGIYTPAPPHLLILMGLPLLLLLVGIGWEALRALRGAPLGGWPAAADADLFLWAWLGIGFLLLYVPTDFQIHMLNTWQIPVALLAVRLLFRRVLPALSPRQAWLRRAAPLLLVLAVLPANIYLIAWRFVDLSRHRSPYFISQHDDAVLAWLEAHANRETVVLSGLHLGQYVPARSDARTFIGHWAQTVDYYGKQEALRRFFDQATDDADRLALLREFDVTYLLYGAEERALGGYAVGDSPLLEPAFASGDVMVYRVR